MTVRTTPPRSTRRCAGASSFPTTIWLVTDGIFGEMHLVCRNVLIYFNRSLHDRARGLFTESLVNGGFLCLGAKEELPSASVGTHYEAVDQNARIYKKVLP